MAGERVAGRSAESKAGTAIWALDGGAKGAELNAVQMRAIGLDGRHRQMAVDGGIAVTGEVLGRGEDSSLGVRAGAFDEGSNVRGNIAGTFAVGADVDNGVVRIAVHVGDGEEDPLHAQRARVPGRNFAAVPGGLQIAGRGECHRVRKQSRVADAHGGAALEIAGDDEWDPRQALHAIHKRRQRVGLSPLDTAAGGAVDQDQAAHSLVTHQTEEALVLPGAGVGRLAVEGDHHQLRHLLAQRETGEPAAHGRGFGGFSRARRALWRDLLRSGNQRDQRQGDRCDQ